VAAYPEALPRLEHLAYLRRLADDSFPVALAALAKAGARELLDSLLAAVPAAAFVRCDKPLWSKLHRAFGIEAFEAVFRELLDTSSELARPALFGALDALLARKDGATWAASIAAHLARLAPAEARPVYARTRRDAGSVGDPGETRILLQASHLLGSEADRQAARASSKLPAKAWIMPARLSW
jgi:hypothetical protein